jgi:ribosomal protein S12 methylthiotransferase accessory factor YcaO
MQTAQTMEQLIESADKQGWRVSNLSCCGASFQYSCILERKRSDSGFGVFASSGLHATPQAALLAACAEAKRKSDAPARVDARHPGKSKAAPLAQTLDQWLAGNVGYRVRLQSAAEAFLAARRNAPEVAL